MAKLTGAQDLAQFRGPGGLGIAAGKSAPTDWSDDRNRLWKV